MEIGRDGLTELSRLALNSPVQGHLQKSHSGQESKRLSWGAACLGDISSRWRGIMGLGRSSAAVWKFLLELSMAPLLLIQCKVLPGQVKEKHRIQPVLQLFLGSGQLWGWAGTANTSIPNVGVHLCQCQQPPSPQ